MSLDLLVTALRILVALLLPATVVPAMAQGVTAYWYSAGLDGRSISAPDWAFAVAEPFSGGIEVQMQGSGFDSEFFAISAPSGGSLAVGAYEAAGGYLVESTTGGISIGAGRFCARPTWRFNILELMRAPDGSVSRLAVDFQRACEGEAVDHYGEMRFNSTIPVRAPGGQPDEFAPFVQSPARAGQLVESNWIVARGFSGALPISIQGGEYSINGLPYTNVEGTVRDLDAVRVRLAAPRRMGATGTARLNIGSRSAEVSVQTYTPGPVQTGIAYQSPAGDWVGAGQDRVMVGPLHRWQARMHEWNGLDLRGAGPAGVASQLVMASASRTRLVPGSYEGATRFGPGHALDFGTDTRGCSATAGRFVVHEAVYDAAGALQRFAADFEQSCEGSMPPLIGEVRLNSDIPLSALAGGSCSSSDLDGDGLDECAEQDSGRDPLVKDNDVFADNRLFAMQQYRDFLGREGDAAGVEHWTGVLASGAQSRAQMVQTFFDSAEFQGSMAPVARLYFAYFLRIPDFGGLQYWTGRFRGGMALEAISDQFAASAEFAQTYGGLGNGPFVDRVYRNVLGRPADASGLAFWTGQLDSGALTRGQLMTRFSESAEYRALAANEVFVTMTYVGMMRREPDAGGFGFWVGEIDSGRSGLSLIQGFLDSQEYRNRFLP